MNHKIAAGLAGLAVAAALSVAACGTTVTPAGHSPSSTQNVQAPSAPAQTTPPAASTMGMAPGDMVNVSTSLQGQAGTITVTAVQASTKPQSEYGEAPANGWFAFVTIKATAADGKQLDINPMDFYAKVNDTHYDAMSGHSFMALDNGELHAVTLNAGESVSGQVAFDVPAQHGEIVYAPGFDSRALASWTF